MFSLEDISCSGNIKYFCYSICTHSVGIYHCSFTYSDGAVYCMISSHNVHKTKAKKPSTRSISETTQWVLTKFDFGVVCTKRFGAN